MAKNSENTKLFTRKKDWTEIKVQGGNQEIENMLSSEFLGMKIYASAFQERDFVVQTRDASRSLSLSRPSYL